MDDEDYYEDENQEAEEVKKMTPTDDHPITTYDTYEQTSDKEVAVDDDEDYDEYTNAENEEIKAAVQV